MAYDWLSIARRIEATYPQAIGGANRDDVLRSRLVPWFNDVLIELDLMQRWSYEFTTQTFLTTSGTSTYPLPTGMTTIKYVYYISSSSQPRFLRKFDRFELAKVYGEASSPSESPGAPVTYSLDNRTLELFPTPNLSGNDSGGNFLIYVKGYTTTSPIVETTGTTTAASATLTAPSTAYLTSNGIVAGNAVSVRGAGYLGGGSVASDLVTTVSTVAATGTTSTLATNAITAQTSAQTFFNSQPWVIQWWPKLAEFGVLREVATYLQDDQGYQKWEARYQHEVELLRSQEVDRTMNLEIFANAHVGQLDSELRRSDDTIGFDYRGGA